MMKKKRSLRLVPLRVMVSMAHIELINYRAETKNGSQGGVIRELLDKELKEIDREMMMHENDLKTFADLERKPSTAKGENK
jgi:hypothetical protein